jgi:hypothetical protein
MEENAITIYCSQLMAVNASDPISDQLIVHLQVQKSFSLWNLRLYDKLL